MNPLLVKLCIDQYTGAKDDETPLDICFVLCLLEWREKIETRALVIGMGKHENLAFTTNFAVMRIQLKGIIPLGEPHQPHPLSSGVDHIPDAVDLEEAALYFNGIGFSSKHKARLELPLPSGVRSYEGVIESIAIIEYPGTDRIEFVMQFGADWNPSFPTLRAFNDE